MKKFKGIFGRNKSQSEGATASVPKNGYDIREKDLPKIHKAAWAGDAQKVKQLAKKDINQTDKENRTALHLAVVLGHKEVVQSLLEWTAKTNICDSQGKTALAKAVECGQEECVCVLLEYGADVQCTDQEKNTPLHMAVREGNQSIAKILLENEAKPNSKNCFGYTPLIMSVLDTNKRDDIARLLLSNGADPNVTDNNTRTALHHACAEDLINHVKLLLQNKASTTMKDAKGWTAEDCAMMKGNHGCAQLLFDHNLKLRKQFSSSLPATPRTESLPASSASTPRPSEAAFGFGAPQTHVDNADDSDDPTSKVSSPGDVRQDSWADDTDISSAMDDHKMKPKNVVKQNNEAGDNSDTDVEDEGGAPKISLTKNVKLDDSDDEGDTNQKLNRTPGSKSPGSFGESVRPVYSRTPTPDARKSPISPTGSAGASKIPVRNNDHYDDDEEEEEEEDVDDVDDDDEGGGIEDVDINSTQPRNKEVSFKDEHDIRNFSPTDDDTDIEDHDDEEEVEPSKKRRIETPEEAADSGYIPSVFNSKASAEQFKEMMNDIDGSDVSDDTEALSEPKVRPGILKPSKDTGKPPSIQQPLESDQYWDSEEEEEEENLEKEDESEWDSTRHSDTPRSRGQETPRDNSVRVESPNTEYDSDIEGTLNPDNSTRDKQANSTEDISEPQDSNTLDVVQLSSTTQENMSTIDQLANTGDINALVINELVDSPDVSHHGSRSSSVAMELGNSLRAIEEERGEKTESEPRSDWSHDTKQTVIKVSDATREGLDADDDTEDDTIDRIEISNQDRDGNDCLAATLQDAQVVDLDDEIEEIEEMVDVVDDDDDDDQKGAVNNGGSPTGGCNFVEDFVDTKGDGFDESDEEVVRSEIEKNYEIEELVAEEMDFYDSMSKDEKQPASNSSKVDNEKSGMDRAKKVLDRKHAPRVLLEYEPSTTEAESGVSSDSDTLEERESSAHKATALFVPAKSQKGILKKYSRTDSMNSDKEVARTLAAGSPSMYGSQQMIENADNRNSVDPTTQDTMEDPMSLADEGDETSQWDSSEENYTPRTPRNLDLLTDTSPQVISYDESEIVEDVEDAMTSFITQKVAPVQPTPEPKSDSSQPRSHDSPDLHTSSNSASGQKTVVAAPQEIEEEDEDDEDKDSEWDSEAEEVTEGEDGQIPVIQAYVSPQQTPRGQMSSVATDDESVSEWEIERQKEKEEKEKQIEKERQQQEENLRRLMEEQDEARRLVEEEERRQNEEDERMQREEEERQHRQAEERQQRQAEERQQRQAEERMMKEAERQKLAELEAEEERQREWEEEEGRRTAELEREALAELERERQAALSDESDFSNFSDNDDHVLPDDNPAMGKSESALHTSQGSEGLARSQGSEHSSGSQKAGRELKKPPPKLVVKQFFQPSKEAKNPVKMGEIENESPVPIQPMKTGTLYTSPTPTSQVNHQETFITAGNQQEAFINTAENQLEEFDDSEDEIEEINDQVEAAVMQHGGQGDTGLIPESPQVEETVTAVQTSQVSTMAARFNASAEFPTTNGYQSSHIDKLLPSNTPPPPPLPTSAPPCGKAMSLQSDGNSADEDDFDQPYMDKQAPKKKGPGRTSFNLPDFSGNTGLYTSGLDPFEDDGLSVTSTENGDISTSYRPDNLPYGKDMLVNMNLNDSNAVLKLQEHLREHRGQLEQERNQKMLLENKQKVIVKEKAELEKSIGNLKYHKSALEQNKLDLEAKIRSLEYSVNEEEEKRKNAEMLLNKTKEHLSKKEEQYTHEMEAKQRAELQMRNLQMELRSAQNQIKELEEEKEELDRLLANEKNARHLQEKINDEQQRLQQHIHEESLKFSNQRGEDMDESESALELADGDIKAARDLVEKYRNEVVALKAELQRQRSRLTDENNLLSSENEKLSQRIEDLKNEVKLNEEALTQLTVQQNLHQSKLISESAMLNNSLEKEQATREKVEAELESVKTRLQTTTIQLEKAQQARNDFERRLHSDREDWARQLERKEQELNKLFEKIQTDLNQANSTETKLNAVENELIISNTSLLERTNQYQQVQRELQHYKGLHDNHDSNLRTEKDRCSKLQIKIDSLNERLTTIQHENLSLRQQLETAHNTASERSGLDLQHKLDHMISNLKADHDKARQSLEEKNNNLQDTISHLREEVRNAENRRSTVEQDLRRLNQEHNDLIRKLSIAEASLDVASKARDNLEQERLALKMEVEKMQGRYQSSQEKTIEAQTRMNELVNRLDQTEQSRLMSNQQLADTSASMQAYNTSKAELEESYQKLQVDNVRLDAELKHEKQKSELLQRDLADTQKVRSSLEALCSNLKSTNAHLEEKLGPGQLREVTASTEAATRVSYAKDAEEHKGLWEQEVLSRSKLGLRIAQLDRQKQETAAQLEEEKRKTRKAAEQKRLAESKLEAEQDKVGTLQKEVVNLKAYLKVAKKKLKASDTNQTRFSTLHSAFDHERNAMEEMLVSVKSQLEHMKLQVEEEQEEKERISQKNIQLENELKTIKKLERSVQKIDRSKRKLEQEFLSYKNNVETGYTEKSTVEEVKKEIEARYRSELNRKLEEVNNYLEEQARTRHRLDSSREEHEEKIRHERKKQEEEMTDIRIKYEQAAAQRETAQQEMRRYRDLYETEMQWRMKLSEQLYRSTDKAHQFKSSVLAERQKNRLHGSLTNLSMNGHALDLSRINSSLADDALSNKLRAELDRSIAKHLEAAPHDQIRPFLRTEDPIISSSNFAKANADYMEVLKRKYCV